MSYNEFTLNKYYIDNFIMFLNNDNKKLLFLVHEINNKNVMIKSFNLSKNVFE